MTDDAAAPYADPVDVIDLARELIRTPSPNPPGDERAVADAVRAQLTRLGLPAAVTIARAEQRPSIQVTLDFGPGGRHLALCGHIDTKPVGDAHWSTDPFDEPMHGDRLYGLGSGDMKAAIAAMLVAATRLQQAPPPRGRLTLLFVADEEDGAYYGAQYVADQGLDADGIVIGEPGGISDDYDRLHLVSRGIARMRLTAYGRQGHSSLSNRTGVRNAGVDVARAAVAVADELSLSVPPNTDRLSDWDATVNTGMLYRGGVGYGVLPGQMAVDTEVRLLPGMHRETVHKAFVQLLDDLNARVGSDVRVDFDAAPNDWLAPSQVAADDSLTAAARQACATTLGAVPEPSVFPGTTDATWFGTSAGIPTLPALGPGLLERAHGADEWVSVTAVRRSVDLYAALARTFCGDES